MTGTFESDMGGTFKVLQSAKIKKMCDRCMIGRTYSILKEDHLLYIIGKFQQILIETVKIRFEQFVLNNTIFLEL